MATSLTRLLARNDHSGLVGTNTVSVGASDEFICAIWSS
jgi:hypothetical protein